MATAIKRIISAGLENVGHSGTTFSYHLYHTCAILQRWQAPEEVRLAGLMHSVLGRESVGASDTGESELPSLIGPEATNLVLKLRDGERSILSHSGDEEWKLTLVEIANAIEQAKGLADIERARRLLADLRGGGDSGRRRA